ncbi:MAG: DoxX family protein [Bacteroidia bacterium]
MHWLFNYPDKYKDIGLLILRIGIGIMFMVHGYPKITGGIEKWEALGHSMSTLGIAFMPAFWGFMASFAEFFGGLMIVLGLFFRPAVALLFITMLVATTKHVAAGDGFGKYSHAAESTFWFLGLFFTGPGRYSVDELWRRRALNKNVLQSN